MQFNFYHLPAHVYCLQFFGLKLIFYCADASFFLTIMNHLGNHYGLDFRCFRCLAMDLSVWIMGIMMEDLILLTQG